MMTIRKSCLCILLIAMAAGIALAQPSGISSGYPTPRNGFSASEQRGHGLYLRYCVLCHGVFGDGNGDTAPFIDPKPRDFTIATFKCRSTPTGTLPLDSDLINTLVRGVETSNMPSWRPLSDENRQDLVAYIKTFSQRWKTEKPGEPIKIPPEPAVDIASIRHGAELFQKVECWKCHGQQGHGDGPSASTLTDSKDQPIHPYNFAAAGNDGRFKCGVTNQDLYRIFMTGLDGTPMPAFADVIQPNDAWDLVHYLRTLQTGRRSQENDALKAAGGPSTLKTPENKSENSSPADSNTPAHSGGH
jgi:cytochrome c oxidase cbb3-type subunit 2